MITAMVQYAKSRETHNDIDGAVNMLMAARDLSVINENEYQTALFSRSLKVSTLIAFSERIRCNGN